MTPIEFQESHLYFGKYQLYFKILMLKFLLHLLPLLLPLLLASTEELSNKKCRERDRPIATENRDSYELVEATQMQNLTLECHYCNENGDSTAKIWYKSDLSSLGQAREVQLSMENEMELNRMTVSADHSLNIYNFSQDDAGLYYCRQIGQEDVDGKYNYLVDLVYEQNATELTFKKKEGEEGGPPSTTPWSVTTVLTASDWSKSSFEIESGNLTDWLKYTEDHFQPINKLFSESEGEEFAHLRAHLKVTLEVVSQWEPWGICEVCGRPNNEGIKRRKGRCRIKLTRASRDFANFEPKELFFLKANAMSCRSVKLAEAFPGISNMTRIVPDFIQQERCEGTCNPDAEGTNKGWKVGKSKAFKYKKTFVLPENSHLTLVCPESTLENTVTWRKRGKTLTAGDAGNPHVVVDTFNTLYLLDVTETEQGNYSCQVDDVLMQQVIVHVFSKSRLLTGEFVRHLGYLGFVLSLTLPCYLAGLIVTWSRRKTFKSYEELLKENPEEDEFEGLL